MKGRVIDTAGQPVYYAHVPATWLGSSQSVWTDEQGYFQTSFSVPVESYSNEIILTFSNIDTEAFARGEQIKYRSPSQVLYSIGAYSVGAKKDKKIYLKRFDAQLEFINGNDDQRDEIREVWKEKQELSPIILEDVKFSDERNRKITQKEKQQAKATQERIEREHKAEQKRLEREYKAHQEKLEREHKKEEARLEREERRLEEQEYAKEEAAERKIRADWGSQFQNLSKSELETAIISMYQKNQVDANSGDLSANVSAARYIALRELYERKYGYIALREFLERWKSANETSQKLFR